MTSRFLTVILIGEDSTSTNIGENMPPIMSISIMRNSTLAENQSSLNWVGILQSGSSSVTIFSVSPNSSSSFGGLPMPFSFSPTASSLTGVNHGAFLGGVQRPASLLPSSLREKGDSVIMSRLAISFSVLVGDVGMSIFSYISVKSSSWGVPFSSVFIPTSLVLANLAPTSAALGEFAKSLFCFSFSFLPILFCKRDI